MPDPLHDPTADRPPDPEGAGRVLVYHELSKHHRHAYALAPAALDWANQPDPFRTFAGAPAIELPLLADALRTSYADLYAPAPAGPKRTDVNSVAVLFELALGLSAWKEYGSARWALRCNPSSGNLHPTEGYAVLPDLAGLGGGVYHYAARDHALERRRAFTPAESDWLAAALPPGCLLVGLSSVHWREAWKYGVRAFRYCQHDTGHALAAVRYAAAALGWSARLLDHAGDAAVAAWLGLDRDGLAGLDPSDREHPAALALVGPAPLRDALPVPPAPGGGPWLGRATRQPQSPDAGQNRRERLPRHLLAPFVPSANRFDTSVCVYPPIGRDATGEYLKKNSGTRVVRISTRMNANCNHLLARRASSLVRVLLLLRSTGTVCASGLRSQMPYRLSGTSRSSDV